MAPLAYPWRERAESAGGRAAAAHFGCCVCCVVVFVLNFNSYASPTHPPYVQDYCEVTGPSYGVTVIMVTVKEGSQ